MKSAFAMTAFRQTVLGLAIAAAAEGAQAITVEANTGMLASPDSFSLVVDSAGGADILSFTLRGCGSLDGDNFWIDIFHLSLNGIEIFAGTFDMGGSFGGTNRILFNPNGGTASPTSFGHFAGGKTEVSVPITLLAGVNTLLFSYESPLFFEGLNREGPQGLGDEGWGLSPIPEAQSYALMLAGLAVVGTLAHRRRLLARSIPRSLA